MNIDKGLFFMPTRNRPASLSRFFDAYRATGATVAGRIVLNLDDWQANGPAYIAVNIPANWAFVPVQADSMCDAMRRMWPLMKELEWVGWIDDDMLPETPGWDKLMVEALTGTNFVSTNDCWQARAEPEEGRMCGAWAFSGELLRAVGYLVPQHLAKSYVDDVWEMIGRQARCWTPRMDITTRHLHPTAGLANPDDTTDQVNKHWDNDTAAALNWRRDQAPFAISAAVSIQPARPERNLDLAGSKVYAKIWKNLDWPKAPADIKELCIDAARAVLQTA